MTAAQHSDTDKDMDKDNAAASCPKTRPLVAVAAAVLLRHATAPNTPTAPTASFDFANPLANYSNPAAHEFLLACRPAGKVYAGYWEFPGGKVEPGETVHAALVRELDEEMGIHITAASPWLLRRFDYPHAHVELRFFLVTAWEGEIRLKEHSDFTWVNAAQWSMTPEPPAHASPMLPANAPILKALALPKVMAITHAAAYGVTAELQRLEAALVRGLRLVQVRDKSLPRAERQAFAEAVCQRVLAVGGVVMINGDAELVSHCQTLACQQAWGNSEQIGLHLTSQQLLSLNERPNFNLVGSSCHTREELEQTELLGLDYAVLGPVLPTATHPDSAGLGWAEATALIAPVAMPVFMIGGMQMSDVAQACAQGAHGIAMLRGW